MASWPRRLRVALAVVVALLALTLALTHIVVPRIVDQAVRTSATRLGTTLGHAVRVGSVRIGYFPLLSITIDGVVIDGLRGRAPLVTIRRVRVVSDLRGLLHRHRRAASLRSVEIIAPSVTVDTSAEGRADLARTVARLRMHLPHDAIPEAAPEIARLDVHDGRACVTQPGLPVLCVTDLALMGRSLRHGAPNSVSISAAILAPQTNVRVHLDLAANGALVGANVHLDPTDASAMLPWLPDTFGARLRARTVDADVGLARGETGVVAHMHVAAGDVAIDGAALLHPGEALPLSSLTLHTTGLTLDAIAPLIPLEALPRHTVLTGPVAVHVETVGTSLVASLDLTDAMLSVHGVRKPAGMPCTASLRANSAGHAFDIAAAHLACGPIDLGAHGSIQSRDNLALTLDPVEIPVDVMLGVAPRLAHTLHEDGAVSGTLRLEGSFARTHAQTDAHMVGVLRQGGMHLHGLAVAGDLHATVGLHGATGNEVMETTFDATHARVSVQDLFDKPSGRELRVSINAARTGQTVTIHHAVLHTAGVACDLHGVVDPPHEGVQLHGEVCTVDLAVLRETFVSTALAALPAGVAATHARFNVALRSDGAPREFSLALDDMNLDGPWGNLGGRVEILHEGDDHRVRFALNGERVDIDALGMAPPAAPRSSHESLPQHVSAGGTVHIGRLTHGTFTAHDLLATVVMRDGRLAFPGLTFGYAGGHVVADGSWFEPESSNFEVNLHAEALDLAVLSTEHDPARRPEGRAMLDGALHGAMRDTATYTGTMRARLSDLSVHGGWSPRAVVLDASGHPLPTRRRNQSANGGQPRVAVHGLSLALSVASSRVQTTEPLVVDLDDAALRLEGSVGFDRTMSLHGTYTLDPVGFRRTTHGQFVLHAPLPIAIALGGTLDAPRFQLTDLGGVVRTLLWARVRGMF